MFLYYFEQGWFLLDKYFINQRCLSCHQIILTFLFTITFAPSPAGRSPLKQRLYAGWAAGAASRWWARTGPGMLGR